MTASIRPLAILGGMFDPIHLGHLRSAVELRDGLDLEAVWLVPCRLPPHRGKAVASAEQRLEMVRLAVGNEPGIKVDERELHRDGPSYSVDTLRSIRSERPDQPLCLVVGQDAFNGFARWNRWETLFELAHIVVLSRPGGVAKWSPELAQQVATRRIENPAALRQEKAGRILFWPVTPLGISSTLVRELLAQRRSVRFLVPDSVYGFIEQYNLYR